MTLTELAGEPELVIEIEGIEYSFSELTIEAKAKLQAWIQKKAPHPLEAVKPHLAGLDTEDRHYVLDQARQEALEWPPDIQSGKGKTILLASDEGQILTLYHGLSQHHPGSTLDGATLVYKALMRESAAIRHAARKNGKPAPTEGKIERIYACLFGLILPSSEEGLPKGETAASPNGDSTGLSSTAAASKNSG